MDHEVLKEMEKALDKNHTLQTLTLNDNAVHRSYYYDDLSDYEEYDVHLPKEFCRHLMIGIGLNTSLSEVCINFHTYNWDCPNDGTLVYVSHMLCDSVGCSV